MENDNQETKNGIQVKGSGTISTGGSKIEIKGEYAAGRDINIIYYSSAIHGKSWLYTQGIRPPTDPANIFGRQRELRVIDEFFKQNTALAITGLRGTGKSTLASMYLDIIEKKGECAGIYWRRMNETLEIGDIVGSFFTVIGKPVKDLEYYKDEDKLALLFRELNATQYFLVFDNFEIMLNPHTNKPLKEKVSFSDLIEKAIECNRSRILFTSWECPASERGIRPICYSIGGLDESAAIQLLRRKGLTEPDDELKKAVMLSGGHPQALILLVQLVTGPSPLETLSDILKNDALWQGEVAENILDKVYKERLNEEERKLLQYVSLYRIPVPSNAVVIAANDPGCTDAVVRKIALNLIRKSLLQKIGENYWEESLIHRYAYDKLVDKVERHKFACQYYLSLPLLEKEKRTKKEDVQSLIEAHYHACMAEMYDIAANIIFDYELYKDLDRWGNYRILVDLYTGVLPNDHLKDDQVLKSKKTHCLVIGYLGNVYCSLGEVIKAIEYYEKALKIAQEIGDKQGEGTWIGNIGTAYSDQGEVKKAIEYYEKALKIAQEIGDKQSEDTWLGNLGNAYRSLDEMNTAIEYYEKALKIAQEIRDRQSEGIGLGNLGTAYNTIGNVTKAIEYYEKALKIAQEIGDKRGEGTWLGNLGNAYYALYAKDTAIKYYEKALKIAQEIGDKRGEGTWLGNLGNAYYGRKAIPYYEKALEIAQEIMDRRNESKWFGNLGIAYSIIGDVTKAIEYYEKALKIAQEIGDKRSENKWRGILEMLTGLRVFSVREFSELTGVDFSKIFKK
jgi:tetratricopeptide (TPR) repeat protein